MLYNSSTSFPSPQCVPMCAWCHCGWHHPHRGGLASSRDEVKVRAPAGYAHRVTDIQGDAQVGLLPHLSPGPSSSFSRGRGHPERLHPFPKDQNRLGLQHMCSGGLSVHRLNLLNSPHFFLGHLPSLTPSLHPWIMRQRMLTTCRKENKIGLMQ